MSPKLLELFALHQHLCTLQYSQSLSNRTLSAAPLLVRLVRLVRLVKLAIVRRVHKSFDLSRPILQREVG